MSGLFSSFIIEPVVRQARRFSSQGSAAARPPGPAIPAPAGAQLQSHANGDAPPETSTADASTAHFSPALGIRSDLVIADDPLPDCVESSNFLLSADQDTVTTATSTATTTGGSELSAEDQDQHHRRRTSVPVTQHHHQHPATTFGRIDEHTHEQAILIDGAVDSIEESPFESPNVTPDDAPPLIPEQPPQPPPQSISPSNMSAEDANMTQPPSPPRQSRTSSARSIPRPQMSLREDSPSNAARSLPADDGMRLLRQRIHQIRELDTSQVEKARRMHELMTEDWQRSIRPQSPASVVSMEHESTHTQQGRAFVPSSPLSTITMPTSPESVVSLPVTGATTAIAAPSFAPPLDPSNPFNIHPEDLQASYRPLPQDSDVNTTEDSAHDDNTSPSSSDPPEPVLGCKHYKRNVKIQCFDCRTWHSCRHCHDASISSHHLNRKATENMLCMLCWTPQAAGQYCKSCGGRAAWYYCDICKLWDDDAGKSIYHCSDCGICRRGEGLGKDFVHCKVRTRQLTFISMRNSS